MVGGRVVLSPEERARLDGSLALVEAALPALEPVHSLQQGLSELLHFAEEDPACCDHIVRSTATLRHTHALLRQAIASGRHADESFALAILAPLLRLLRDLAVQSQSKHVFDVLTKQDGATAVVLPMLTGAVGSALEPFVRFVALLLSGPEGEGFRTALWSAGAAACIAQRQQQQQQQYESSSESLRRCLANLTTALVGWPRIPSAQDVDILSTHTFAIVADPERGDAPSHPACLRAATALLLANPSTPSAHTQQCVTSVAPALGNAVLRATFGESSSPELASAAIAFAAAARTRNVGGLGTVLDAVAGSPASGAVLEFAERVLATLPDVKRGGENAGDALAKLEALVRSVPPGLVDLHRHVLVGTIDAVRALVLPLLNIDSGIGAGAARLMAFVVQTNPPAASRFVDLGGPGILLDMLKDYDEPIIAGALMLLAALTAVPSATQAIIHWHLLERIVRIFRADVCGIASTSTEDDGEHTAPREKLPPFDLTASVLLYLRQLASCPGLRGAPTELFADFTSGLITLLSNLLDHHQETSDSKDSATVVVDLLVLTMDTSGAALLSSWPMTDAAVSAAATSFADAAVTAFTTRSSGNASVARAATGLIAAATRAGGPSSRAQIALNAELVTAFAQRLALSAPRDDGDVDESDTKAAAGIWGALAALTSSCPPAVDAIAAHTTFPNVVEAALATCHRSKSALAFTDEEDPRGPPQVVLVACPVLEFIGHVAKCPGFNPPSGRSLVAVTELAAVIASHPHAPLPLRASAVDALQSLAAVAPIDNVAHHLLAVLLACEEGAADDVAGAESARMLANRAFKLMISDAPRTMRTLFTIATEAFAKFESKGEKEETPYRSPTRRGGSEWRWAPLDEVLDRDDAHDLLVVLLPLLNGCLNQERNCSVALLEEFPAESWQFFLAVIANDSTELGLKIVSVLGLGNLINHCRTPADAVHLIAPTSDVIGHLCALHATLAPFNPLLSSALEFAERNALPPLDPGVVGVTLERVHGLASMGMPAITAIADALEILYYVAERVVMLSRGVNAAHAVWSTAGAYLVRAAVRDVHTHHTARSCLLVAVQEAAEFVPSVADAEVRRELALGLTELGRIESSSTGTQQQVAAALAHLSHR